MAYKVLEKNGIEITSIDGAAMNRFAAGNRDGILQGFLSECAVIATGNAIAVSAGVILISGMRFKITGIESITMTSAPSIDTRYQLVVQISINGEEVTPSIFVQVVSEVRQDDLFVSEPWSGIYQVEIGRFTHTASGQVTDAVRTLDRITGGSGSGAEENYIRIGEITTETLDAGLNAEVDLENVINSEGKSQTNFHFSIPQGGQGPAGANGAEGLGWFRTTNGLGGSNNTVPIDTITVPAGRTLQVGSFVQTTAVSSRYGVVNGINPPHCTVQYVGTNRGADGANGTNGRRIEWRGAWKMDEDYNFNASAIDAVEYNGSTYFCVQSHVSESGREPDAVSSQYWALAAAKGDTGPQGEQGPAGANGANGQDGAPGDKILRGTAVPASGLGTVDDLYLRTTNWNLYQKTGATAWTNLGSIQGAPGTPGQGAQPIVLFSGNQIINGNDEPYTDGYPTACSFIIVTLEINNRFYNFNVNNVGETTCAQIIPGNPATVFQCRIGYGSDQYIVYYVDGHTNVTNNSAVALPTVRLRKIVGVIGDN